MSREITNDSKTTRSYTASNGQKIVFEPGETKELNSLPPDPENWRIEATEETKTTEETEEGGEN